MDILRVFGISGMFRVLYFNRCSLVVSNLMLDFIFSAKSFCLLL